MRNILLYGCFVFICMSCQSNSINKRAFEFTYTVNLESSKGKKIYGETVVGKLEEINVPVDLVNVFRPSKEAPIFAQETVKIKAKVLWLQYGIQNSEAEEIVKLANIAYVANKCIKQEYQKLFLKVNPVFPVLQ